MHARRPALDIPVTKKARRPGCLRAVTLAAALASSGGLARADGPETGGMTGGPVRACEAAPPADGWVKERFAALVALWRDRLPGPAGEGRVARQVVAFVGTHADFGDFARRALGPGWEAADEERRARWAGLLRTGLERRYLDQLRAPLGVSLSVDGMRGDCDGLVVTVVVRHRLQREPHTFEVVLRWDGAAWRATDAIVDEASLLEHYRARLRRIHAAGGIEAVDTYLASFGGPAR
jgi:ABC-type transporter MlaC component